ncbi:MAG: TIGR04283 family arsenosugar biosynthesis glycosyltransferase [Desulfuromonadales bacterium]|jgi:rSAM/selenodomain-associated transferase 2
MASSRSPELSIIVPVLHEIAILPALFHTLAGQRRIDFELILSDGGSADGTWERARILARENSFPCRVIEAERGRGRQLNAGAAVARGDCLLFLHADSDFADPLALCKGLAALRERVRQRADERVAGRFALRFRGSSQQPSLAYYFYENKARLNRPGCIHGDQGFFLTPAYFHELGGFDSRLPILEDDRLAAQVFKTGEWLLLPAEIFSSARRFESEGLRQRQTLNALLTNFADIGWEDYFLSATSIYRRQNRTKPLSLYPYFAQVRTLLKGFSGQQRLNFWYRTGAFVRANAWQISLFIDVRHNFSRHLPVGQGALRRLRFYDRWLEPVIDHPPGRLAAGVLTWIWFHLSLWQLRRGVKITSLRQGVANGTGDD